MAGRKKKPDSEGIVATASALAMDDAARGKLTDSHPDRLR